MHLFCVILYPLLTLLNMTGRLLFTFCSNTAASELLKFF
uniref:Uncharacterized protein n=1 Tax=Anguilla anguilla TaxID=7936 RepID=A0A0E9QE85_ANGAN